jgi:signal transduction histidine kinase
MLTNSIQINQITLLLVICIIILFVLLIYFRLKISFLNKDAIKTNLEIGNYKSEVKRLQNEITDRTKNLEKALQKAEESNRLKSLFLANMSHEIRTPLNGIMGFTELIVENNLNISEKELYAFQISENSQNLLKLIDQIFHLSIIETGKVNIKKTKFKIGDLLKTFEFEMNEKIAHSDKKIKLSINNENQNYLINTDKEKLNLILSNLFDNAIKFTSHGIIELTCLRMEKEYLFQITDSGSGLREDEYEMIFDPFTQGSETLKKIKGGSGLGLSNVKNYVILLGGKIWCEKNKPNGSIFSFTIPAPRLNETDLLSMLQVTLSQN